MKLSKKKIAKLIAALPWKMDAHGYAIIKRSHVVTFLVHGKILGPDELVHHANEIKSDDRPENLQVMTKSEHAKHHAPNKLTPGVEYTPELREKRRQQLLGNKHAAGPHEETPEVKARRVAAKLRYESEHPEVVEKKKEKLRDIWARRKAGELPWPNHGGRTLQ